MQGFSQEEALAERAANLFRYLAALQRLQQVTVRSSSRYVARGGRVLYLSELPAAESVIVPSPDQLTEPTPVLTVSRTVPEDSPLPPPELAGLLIGDLADANKPPELGSTVTGPFMKEDQRSRITEAYGVWREEWDAWADRERKHAEARELYADLFAVREQLSAAPQDWELLLALGRLQVPAGLDPVDRHLIVLPLQIDLQASTGAVMVHVAEGAQAKAEFDMLSAEELMFHSACRELEDEVSLLPESHALFADQWRPPLQRFVNSAMSEGVFTDLASAKPAQPEVSLSPAIIMRPRNRSGLLRALDGIAEDLASLTDIPDGIRALVDPDAVPVTPAADRPDEGGAAYERDGEFYLPLPVNNEQLQVLGRADSRPLTVVQGPPGTGKTHTTAVLISHFLTQGKRVLVTAQTQQALREVRDKLPDEIKDLAVSVLGNDRQEMANLRASINAISQKAQAFSTVENESAIDAAEQEIAGLSRRRAELRNQLIEAGSLECAPRETPYGRERLAEVAQRILAEELDLPWAAELLPEATLEADPPDVAMVREYLELTTRWQQCELADDVKSLPSAEVHLPDVAGALDLLTRLDGAEQAMQADADRTIDGGYTIALRSQEDIATLRGSARALLQARSALRHRNEPWVNPAIDEIKDGKTRQWTSRRDQIQASIDAARALLEPASAQGLISVAQSDSELRPLLASLLEYTASNDIKVDASGQPKTGMMAARPVKAGKPLFDAVRIAGRPPTSHSDFSALRSHFELIDVLDGLDKSWPAGTPVSDEDSASERVAWHQDELKVLDSVLELIPLAAEVDQVAGQKGIHNVNTSSDEALSDFIGQLDAISRQLRVKELEAELGEVSTDVLRESRGASCLTAVAQAIRDRDAQRLVASHRFAERVLDEARANERRLSLRRELYAQHARLVEAIDADPFDERWPDRLGELQHAWSLNAARRWVDARARFNPNLAQAEIAQIDSRIRSHVSELVGRKAWANAVDRLTPGRKADLQYYAQLVKSYGKGTGKRAGQLQVEIRKALANCRDAVPVWIMPLHQVADSQDIAMNAFDVVVVDEASQAGLESLFLQYLAPKLVVVGDDKQVSPSAVGVQVDEVNALANRFLSDNRYKAAFADPGRSLFDEAKMRYPDVITLREHRRCVPAIIGFSNEVAYAPEGVSLIPVREPGASALQPVLTHFCADGYYEGSGASARNPVEAEAIVATIQDMIKDPNYGGKTIGVISLLGPGQAKLIERMLISAIPPEEIVDREIRCGDSASFQGAERDVMLLSLVAAPTDGRRVVALTRDAFVQRYNVAASRAKDQMILFYSMPLELLQNDQDMRYRLVEYCERVSRNMGSGFPGSVTDPPPSDYRVDPFDSLFEQRVCGELVSRGFVVVPQYESLGYRIDLVVVGANGKIAVECDGDHWHGPERFGADLARQRDLERCGWSFYRILESDFILDHQSALRPLLELLEQRGILPGARAPEPPLFPVNASPTEPEPSPTEGSAFADEPPEAVPSSIEPRGMAARVQEEPVAPEPLAPITVEPVPAEATGGGDPHAEASYGSTLERLMRYASLRDSSGDGEGVPEPADAAKAQESEFSTTGPQTVRWQASSASGPLRLELAPYDEVRLNPLPKDVITDRQMEDALVEAASIEGPIVGSRLIRIVHRARGHKRLKKPSDVPYLKALEQVVAEGRLTRFGEETDSATYWLPGTPSVQLRHLGPRGLDEVPVLELAEVIRRCKNRYPNPDGDDGFVRAVLQSYGLVRMTDKVFRFITDIERTYARGD